MTEATHHQVVLNTREYEVASLLLKLGQIVIGVTVGMQHDKASTVSAILSNELLAMFSGPRKDQELVEVLQQLDKQFGVRGWGT